jgi:hypothetical protein
MVCDIDDPWASLIGAMQRAWKTGANPTRVATNRSAAQRLTEEG